MLEQEEAELQVHQLASDAQIGIFSILQIHQTVKNVRQNLLEERLRNPSPSLEERIERAKRRAHQVRVKIQQDLVKRHPCCF